MRTLDPTQRATRVALELLAAVLWPFQVALAVVLPLLPVTAAIVADLERLRASTCGEEVRPHHLAAGSWRSWVSTRIRGRGVWRHDVPVLLASLVLGLVGLVVAVLGVVGGVVLLAAPGLWEVYGIGVTVGPWTVGGRVEAWLATVLGVVFLVLTWWLLTLVSFARDTALRLLDDEDRQRLEHELGSVRTSRASMLEAFESERRRIERDLHDGAQQDLTALSITLGLLEHHAESLTDGARVAELAARAHEQADRALVRLRETVHGIHPRELTDHGFVTALDELADRSPLTVVRDHTGDDAGLPSPVSGALYFVVAEALTNVVRHAGVDRARLHTAITPHQVRVVVADDGCGGAVLGPEPDPEGGAGAGSGTGLAGLRERVRALGGELVVTSPPGGGTTVMAVAPVHRDWWARS